MQVCLLTPPDFRQVPGAPELPFLSWQVVPTALIEMLRDEDEAKSARVMRAMMRMGKIDIGELKRAYEAETS